MSFRRDRIVVEWHQQWFLTISTLKRFWRLAILAALEPKKKNLLLITS